MNDGPKKEVSFFVPGDPIPKGSMRAVVNRRTGRAVVFGDNAKTRSWQSAVELYARSRAPIAPWDGPVSLLARFFVARPASHITKGGKLKSGAPVAPCARMDLDKLLRAIGDALTGIVYLDDGQVVHIEARKEYGASPGVEIMARRIEP